MAYNNSFGKTVYNFLPINPAKEYIPGQFLASIQQDLNTMVFCSRIPSELDDDDMMELLGTCGALKAWKRVKNVDGSRTHYGFCIFETALGVIR